MTAALLCYVRLTFAQTVGPEGWFVLAAGDTPSAHAGGPGAVDPGTARLTGLRRDFGSADVLLIRAAGDEIPLAVATHVEATGPVTEPRVARARLARLREDPDARAARVHAAVGAVNVAVRAHRVGSGDPYTTEVTPEDARAVHLGYATGEQLLRGRSTEEFEVPRRAARSASERGRAAAFVARVLGGAAEVLVAEDMLMRALLDRAHGRERSAALQARAALDILVAELAQRDAVEAAAAASESVDLGAELHARALAGELDADGRALLDQVLAVVDGALREFRTREEATAANVAGADAGPSFA